LPFNAGRQQSKSGCQVSYLQKLRAQACTDCSPNRGHKPRMNSEYGFAAANTTWHN
jgi:hypothetical protein